MRVDLLTREYPPEVYGGGAGVHVAELVRALRREIDVAVRCFGAPRDEPRTYAYPTPEDLVNANPALATLGTDLAMAQDVSGADLAHSHTWYANFAGFTAKRLHGSRTSSQPTASSRCARGRPSSSAGGDTASRRGPSRRRSKTPTP